MSETPTPTNTLVTFLDAIGRTIIAEPVTEKTTDKNLAVKNPAVVQVVPNPQTGQLALQILPLFFREFQADKTEDTIWNYHRDTVTESDPFAFDFKLHIQYQQLFAPVPQAAPTPQNSSAGAPVVKLFED
jgi:hypothetical protein